MLRATEFMAVVNRIKQMLTYTDREYLLSGPICESLMNADDDFHEPAFKHSITKQIQISFIRYHTCFLQCPAIK